MFNKKRKVLKYKHRETSAAMFIGYQRAKAFGHPTNLASWLLVSSNDLKFKEMFYLMHFIAIDICLSRNTFYGWVLLCPG